MNNEIAIIVAKAKNNVIGVKGQIPWYIPDDLKYFKKVTTGGIVIMGKRTYESIGKPLPNRYNCIISSTIEKPEGIDFVFSSIKDAIETLTNNPKFDSIPIYFIGGSRIYNEGIRYATKLYVTEIDTEFEGDTYFPDIDVSNFNKCIVETHTTNDLTYSFVIYDKIN